MATSTRSNMNLFADCYRYTRLALPVLRQNGQAGRCAVAELEHVQHIRCPHGVMTASTSLVRQMRHFQPSEASSIWPRRLLTAYTAHGSSSVMEAPRPGILKAVKLAHWSPMHILGHYSASHKVQP